MLDVHAIINLTEPARCPSDHMARLELRDDLHRLLRALEERHALPLADGAPAMEIRQGLLRMLRGYEDLHGLDRSVPTLRSAAKKRFRAA